MTSGWNGASRLSGRDERPREQELHDRVPLPDDDGYQDLRQMWSADNELGGVNETYYVTFEDGSHGIYKPVSGEMMDLRSSIQQGTYADREVAAFRLTEDVGIDDLIPTTTLHDGPEVQRTGMLTGEAWAGEIWSR